MTSIATNNAAVRVQYHGDKNSENEINSYNRLAAVCASPMHQTMPLDYLLPGE